MSNSTVTIDGNEAAARVAYQLSEVIAIYPITPSSPMGEWADQWAAEHRPNRWGAVPSVIEMQSEGGAAGALHGALQRGALATTFTASQGLLLMIPNMYKIAGELTPAVVHVAARALAAQGLSIFGDHSDVMAARQTGFAMLASNSVQEAHDFALIAHAATLEARLPFLHFFDGFRTSHEVAKITPLGDDDIAALIDENQVRAFRGRALSPEHPVMRGTAQNPDVYFQGRESVNPYYLACPEIVARLMDRLGARTGRRYRLFDYVGAQDAERVIVAMGSGAETVEETALALVARGEKVGLLKVRLFRPFAVKRFIAALPKTVRGIAVLDRTKEPGSTGEPLYQDVVTALAESVGAGTAPFAMPRIIGGRFGLGSKEFTPAMAAAVFAELSAPAPRNHFTIGIADDVTHTSLAFDPEFTTEDPGTVRALFYGLGADGTVGANKNSIKIIGEGTPLFAQGYFVYDSKKSGSVTVSHLRFGPRPIRSAYLISRANFVAVHQFGFLERFDVLEAAEPGATILLNAPYGPGEVWDRLPRPVQEQVIARRLKLYVIDALAVADKVGLGRRINSVMQTCFFAISGVLPRDEAIVAIKDAIQHTYGRRGEAVVQMNFAAVDNTLAALHQVTVPAAPTSVVPRRRAVPIAAPRFVQEVTARMLEGHGDLLPVSAIPADGTWPTATSQWEKRDIATEIPVWDDAICIQCGKCVLVCPHAVIRAKVVEPSALAGAPDGFRSSPARWKEFPTRRYTLQVAVEDCTGCALCVEVCPVKNKKESRLKALNMAPQAPLVEAGRAHWDFFQQLENPARAGLSRAQVKDVQLLQPMFEFSGACAGCGETPYLRMLTQLFGDRMLVANATGCSSIYGGNLPTTPWSVGPGGRGPAWANSLFEDNAEFGLGMRIAVDQQRGYARTLVGALREPIGADLADALLGADQRHEDGVDAQRGRVAALKARLAGLDLPQAVELLAVADTLIETQVWIIGGDGWAYDIGYGGLDHVLASGRNVNILVLDTEVYSNTGGQASKATPRGAVAKFAAGGRGSAKKDLALMAIAYGNVYVAQVAFGADDAQTLKALSEAAAWPGPSLVIAYSHCIAHGYDLVHGLDQQKIAVKSGYWPLFRYDPSRLGADQVPLQLDCKAPSLPLTQFTNNESRYRMLVHADPDAAKALGVLAQHDVEARWKRYAELAAVAAPESPEAMIDLRTRYLGLTLDSPLVVSPSPLCQDIGRIREMEDAGAAAVVLHSLFEEQIEAEGRLLDAELSHGIDSSAESLSYLPELTNYNLGPEQYLEHVRRAKSAVSIPIIGSLNGASPGGWVRYARLIEQAGADALELNIYFVAADLERSGADIEARYEGLVRSVRAAVRIPLAVKLGHHFSAFGHFARRVAACGANGLVLFNRFYQPDLDIDTLEVTPSLTLSASQELLLRLTWVAILHGRIEADLAVTGGVHSARDVLKCMMAGANVAMMTSALLRNGIPHLATVTRGMRAWMEEHEYASIEEMRGSLSQRAVERPEAYERANYLRVLSSYAM